MSENTFEESLTNTLEIPLEQETAIPAPRRGRNNSLIPVELLNDKGRGNREQAALATVFGVLEYSESKIFWERLPVELSNSTPLNENHSYFSDTHSFYTKQSSSPSPSQQQNDSASMTSTNTFLLPDIPTVSTFNDILVNDENGSDLLFPSNASSVLLHSMIPKLQRTKSESSIKSSFTFDSTLSHALQLSSHNKNNEEEEYGLISKDNNDQVTTPLLFIGYPPSIFDLLKSDEDDRIIIWGSDPNESSTVSTTATTTSNNSRPSTLRGFSSNTTTSSLASSSSTQDLPQRQQTLPEKLKRSLRSNSLRYRASTDNLRSILLLKRTFGGSGNNKFKKQSNENNSDQKSLVHNAPKVIEAASVEKLVEKLTNTLDYEFMTDFFLTYRSFISPTQLCKLIILRFRWALENDDAERRIVRIRTFVVMRHWLLNYFVHDFIPSRDLRVVLTTFLNVLPSHPLVKSSPRDQRIVKGLKRVVRRLKKVYYSGSNSQRVQVIAPPPPTSEQEKVEEMVRANLSHGILRRKTALVRGVDVGGKHNGNTAIQDAQHAPMVVIGSVRTTKADNQSQTDSPIVSSNMSIVSSRRAPSVDTTTARSAVLPFSIKSSQSEEISTAKKSYFKRMEHEKRMNTQPGIDLSTSCAVSQASVASDDSLESDLTPGTTEIASDEDDYFDQEEDDDDEEEEGSIHSGNQQYEDAGPSQHWKSQKPINKIELERRRKEEEEERERAAFFSASNISTLKSNDSFTVDQLSQQQQQKQLTSSSSGFDTLSSGSEAITPSISLDAIRNLEKTNENGEGLTHLSQLGTTTSTIDTSGNGTNDEGDDDNSFIIQHAATLAALEKFDGPIKKAAIGDMSSRIPRAPYSKWCQTDSNEKNKNDPSSSEQPLIHNINFDDLLHDNDSMNDDDNHKNYYFEKENKALADDQLNNNNNNNNNNSDDNTVDNNKYPHSAPTTPTSSTIPTGLSRRLSRKSIERRKSEKNLRASSSNSAKDKKASSTPNSPHHRPVNNDSVIPPMPELSKSEALINSKEDESIELKNKNAITNTKGATAITTSSTTANTTTTTATATIATATSIHSAAKPTLNDEFESIPYDQTVSPTALNSSTSKTSTSNHKRGLSKKFVNMVFSKSTSSSPNELVSQTNKNKNLNNNKEKSMATTTETTANTKITESNESTKIQLDDEEAFQSPIPFSPTPVASTSKKTISSVNSTLVSRIAQELRESEQEFEIECDCMRCTGHTTGPRACRRFSLALISDDAKRHSVELRLKRRASTERKPRPSRLGLQHEENEKKKEKEKRNYHPPRTTQNGPMYLGQLGTIHSESDLDVHIQEIDDDSDSSSNDDDDSSSDSSDNDPIEYLNDTKFQRHSKQVHLSNGSLDRLTGIATKGDEASVIHRQVFSVATNQSTAYLDDDQDDSLLQQEQDQSQQHKIPLSLNDPSLNSNTNEIPPWENETGVTPIIDDKANIDNLIINHHNNNLDYNDIDTMQNLLQDISSSSSSFILSYRSSKLAQQFCIVERDVLLDVDWEEMVHCRWTKMTKENNNNVTSKLNTMNNNDNGSDDYLPNAMETDSQINYTRENRKLQLNRQDTYGGIEQVIERFNTVCQWVASEIVCVEKLDIRVKVVEKFIRLAQKCRIYSNYATLVQILLGLQSPSVSRLKRTWARVRAKEMKLLEELSQFTSPMRNWKHIRDNMTLVAEEYGMSPTEVQVEMPGATSNGNKKGLKLTKVKIPFGGCIPFLGIYLSDLVFNSEQPPYLEPNHSHHKIYKEQIEASKVNLAPVLKQPLVNFRKHRITATVIKRVLTFQNLARRYAFDLDDELYERCLFLAPLDADSIRQLSHAIE